MTGRFLSAIIPLIPLFLFGCGVSEREALNKDLLDTLGLLVKVLSSIKDEASAEEAAPVVERIGRHFMRLEFKIRNLGKAAEEDTEAFIEKYSEPLEEATKKLRQELRHVARFAEKSEGLQRALQSLEKSW